MGCSYTVSIESPVTGKGTFSKELWKVSCFFCTMRRCWEYDPKTSDPSVWSSFRAGRGIGWFEWQPISNVLWNIDWEILLQLNMKGGIVWVSGGMDQWVRACGALPDDEFDPQDQCDARRSWVSNLQISKNHIYFDLPQVLQSFERENLKILSADWLIHFVPLLTILLFIQWSTPETQSSLKASLFPNSTVLFPTTLYLPWG